MANGPTRVCVFNVKPGQQYAPPIVPNQTGSNLIDIVTGCDGVVVSSLGAASYGVPVVLNPNGVIDPSLLNTGVSAVASVNLSLGAPLVHLYSVGGVLTAELAEAGTGSPASLPLTAQGFLTSPIDAGQSGTVAFSGLFTYIDPNSEFSLSSVGQEVYLSAVTPGGITLTRPSTTGGILDQTVGYVVAFTAPNVVTAIFLAGYNDFTRISGCLLTSQLCSTQGTGAYVQLTGGAPPPSPVTTQLGSSANYALLAYSGITNAAPATSITGGKIGSAPTMSITGFNPPTATVDNASAPAARTAGQAAYTYYSGLTPTLTGLSNLSVSGNGANASTYNAGVYSGGALDIPTTITLDAQGNPNAVFVFIAASTVTLESGASILLVNGAQAANVVWTVGSSFTSVATSTMVGNILAYASITLGGGILTGRALAVGGGNGAVSISAATAVTVPSGAGAIIAGDIVTYDVFGNTQDSGISLAGVLSSIFVNPMTTAGDIIFETSGPLGPARLPIGTTGQVLTVVGGFPAWQTTVLAQTFTPVASEYLTGYTAGTGLFTAAVVSTVSGVTISGTPSTGQVLTATSATAADWQTPSGSAAGGSPTQIQYNLAGAFAGITGSAVDTHGNVTLTPTSGGSLPALTVNDDGGGINDIAQFNSVSPAYTVVEIGQPLSGNAAITVVGDAATSTFLAYQHGGSGVSFDLDKNGLLTMSGSVDTASDNFPFIINNQTSVSNLTGTINPQLHGLYSSLQYSGSAAPTAAVEMNNVIASTITGPTSDSFDTLFGLEVTATVGLGVTSTFTTNPTSGVTGISIITNHQGTGNTLLLAGEVVLIEGFVQAVNITDMYGVWIQSPYAASNFTGTTNAALRIDDPTTGTFTNTYAILVGGGLSQFNGNVQLTAELLDSASSPGTSGQVLSSTVTGTKWSSLSNSASVQTVRSGPFSIAAATLGGPYTINFTTAFADNNYTVNCTAVINEVSSYGAVTTIIAIASVQLQPSGVGVIVSVSNADSIPHTVTINVTAIHD